MSKPPKTSEYFLQAVYRWRDDTVKEGTYSLSSCTEEEKAHIQQRLLELGRTLFLNQGLRKTSLEELTQPLGIAKSSFYLFFESKEGLYLELLMQERARLEQQVMGSCVI